MVGRVWVVAGASLAAMLSVGASTASAAVSASHLPLPHLLVPRLSGIALPQVRPLPSLVSSNGSFGMSALSSGPVAVTVNGITYQMRVAAFGFSDPYTPPVEVDVGLGRLTRSAGAVVAVQAHDYAFAPVSGVTFTHDAALSTATLDTGTGIPGSEIDLTFSAVAHSSFPCTLLGGGKGTFQEATGRLSARTFTLATGTTPFFGDITTAPTAATFVSDPGCAGSTGGSGGPGGSRHLPCSGRETIDAQTGYGVWFAEVGFGGRHAAVGAFRVPVHSPTSYVAHFGVGLEPATDLPQPWHSSTGASAGILSTGNPLVTGAARFVSHHPPQVSAGHLCSYGKYTHRFTAYRYAGALVPAASPLAMLFDTGTIALRGQAATMVIRRYTS